jgi:SAM-dependent methyltransferase
MVKVMISLQERRRQSALLSRGISSNPIYRLALRISQSVQLGMDVLDFGAGSGHLVRQLADTGYSGTINGADLQGRPPGLPETIGWVQSDLNEPLPLPDQSFSAILSTEVLTSLENPRFVFREFSRLLRPCGVLVVTNPNQESVRSLITLVFGGHFAAFRAASYPPAITALLRQDFVRLCQESGFAPPQFFYTDCGGIPRLPNLLWQQVSFGLLKGRLFSDNLALLTHKR